MRGFFAFGFGVCLLGCGSGAGEMEGPEAPSQPTMTCSGPQPPVVQNVRWLGLASAPGKAPLGGIAAEVDKTVELEEGASVIVREVKYTPIAADRNAALAKVTVRRGGEEKDVKLARDLPGGVVCYQQALGMWIGLVETVPNKAMIRVGLPPKEP